VTVNNLEPPKDNFGMDGLARIIGIDIEKVALELALKVDGTKPTQVFPIDENGLLGDEIKVEDL